MFELRASLSEFREETRLQSARQRNLFPMDQEKVLSKNDKGVSA